MTKSKISQLIGLTPAGYLKLENGSIGGRVWHWDKLEDILGIPQRVLREDFPSDPKPPKPKPQRCPTCGQTIKQKKDRIEKVSEADSIQSES